jgi:hypothetical protein
VVQFFDLYDAIVNHDPPSLPGDQFSKEFCDFVAAWYARPGVTSHFTEVM